MPPLPLVGLKLLHGPENRIDGTNRFPGVSVAPETSRRFDLLKVREIEIANRAQGFRRRAVLKARGQGIQPVPIFVLQGHELGHGVPPSLRSAAPVARSPVSHPRAPVGMRRTEAGLPLRRGHRPVALRLSAPAHAPTPNPLRNGFGVGVTRLSIPSPGRGWRRRGPGGRVSGCGSRLSTSRACRGDATGTRSGSPCQEAWYYHAHLAVA
jgi:hypothetical protein